MLGKAKCAYCLEERFTDTMEYDLKSRKYFCGMNHQLMWEARHEDEELPHLYAQREAF